MKKYFLNVAIVLAGIFLASGIFAAEGSIDLTAQTTVNEPYCKGVVYSFPLPAGEVYFKGLSGYVSMTPTEPIFTQSLVWAANVPSGNCPASGSELNEAALPDHTWLASYILKNSDNKKTVVDTNFQLPVKIPIKGCIIVIVGGCGVRATPLTSESHMTLLYDTTPLNGVGKLVAPVYELGYGGAVGASGSADCTGKSCAFASVWRADGDYALRSIYGDVSASGLNGLAFNPPTGNWSVDFDYYLYKNCDEMKNGTNGPADYYSRIPADAVALHQINQNVVNRWSGQVPVDKISLFGGITDKSITGDWNGDGKTEIGNYKGNGVWALDYNGNGIWDGATIDKLLTFGGAGDLPIVGDWNGDGKTEIGNYKGNGVWALDYNGNGIWDGATVDKVFTFGSAADQPVTGDWNGDGKDEIGNYKGNGVWALDYNGNGIWDGATIDKLLTFGGTADQPVTGDWNGDGKDEPGFYRSLNFYLFGIGDNIICSAGSVSGCKVCNADGSAWVDTNSRCAANQVCSNGTCMLIQNCLAKTCVSLGNYQCGSWSDGCGKMINCGVCTGGKICSFGGLCIASGDGVIESQPKEQMTRAEILVKIAEIKELLIKLIIQLIAELQKQLLAMQK